MTKRRTHIKDRQNIRRNVHTSSGNNSKEGLKCQNHLRCKQRHIERQISNANFKQFNGKGRGDNKWQTRRRGILHIT